jgi:purine-cytosine permease-like protein
MIIACVVLMASFAGLSYLGVLESWGFYVLFLLCPLVYILMMETLHPTFQKVKARNNLRKGRAGK